MAEQPLKDIIVVMRDTGIRNARELYCMRVENVDFDAGTIFTPDSKTESGRRFIPMRSRVRQVLEARCAGRSEGWVYPASASSKGCPGSQSNSVQALAWLSSGTVGRETCRVFNALRMISPSGCW